MIIRSTIEALHIKVLVIRQLDSIESLLMNPGMLVLT